MFQFLARRFDDDQRTIVTTNLDEHAIEQRYGAALLDRFRAHGLISELDDSDYARA